MTSWPYYSEDEIEAAVAVLRSGKVNYWTGQECRDFESEFAESCNTQYAVAVANGTVALELALRAFDIGPGDEVIVTPRTFIASASSVVSCGARPVFADVDPDSQNITAGTIQKVLTSRTRAIIAVHLAGWPCDMDAINTLAKDSGLKVIEDCAQAHGAIYKGMPVGSLGDVAAFSFCQDKIISTGGEGGMLVTNDSEIWNKAWSFKDHGKSYDAVYNREHPPGYRWIHHSFGTNWRMTEIQAAIGRRQLRKLSAWNKQRNINAACLAQGFRNIPALRVIDPPDNIVHAYYKYDVFLRQQELDGEWDRDRILAMINARGVACFSGPCPEVYLEKAFDVDGLRPARRLPVARELGETCLTFLVHPTLGEQEMGSVCAVVDDVLCQAARKSPSVTASS